jgi:hypothetical protein
MRNAEFHRISIAIGLLGASLLAAKGSKAPVESDRIEVIAHIPLSGPQVVHLTIGTHWRRSYLYLDQGSGSPVTVFDVTHAAAPTRAAALDIAKQEANGDISAVVGTAVLVTSAERLAPPQTITILSLANAEHPVVARQFLGVTAMVKDDSRRIIYLTNGDGLWVLRLEPATDVELEKEYEHYVLYNP